MKRLWLIVVVCALLAGCSVKPRLLKVDCTLRSAYWDSGCVIGAVANDSAYNIDGATITFNFYDVFGNLVGTGSDSINGWEAGGIWNFKVIPPATESQITNFVLVGISQAT